MFFNIAKGQTRDDFLIFLFQREEDKEDKAPVALKIDEIERNPRKLIVHLDKSQRRNATCRIDISFMGNITANDTSGIFMNHYNDASGQKQ